MEPQGGGGGGAEILKIKFKRAKDWWCLEIIEFVQNYLLLLLNRYSNKTGLQFNYLVIIESMNKAEIYSERRQSNRANLIAKIKH